MKNPFHGAIRLQRTEESIHDCEDMSIETSQTEKYREKKDEKKKKTGTDIQELCSNYTDITNDQANTRRRRVGLKRWVT